MRLTLVATLFAITGCREHKLVAVSDPAFDYSTDFPMTPPVPRKFSDITYPVKVVGYDSDGKHVKVIQATPDFALAAFDGVLLGRDEGEFGGELVFRKRNGTIQRLLQVNIHGIFRMPFGIVVFAGLAHLTMNEGAIYMVSRSSAGVISADMLRRLPGAPSDVFRTTNGDLVFRVMSGKFEKQGKVPMPVKDCYLLNKSATVEPLRCSSIVKAGK